MADPYFVLSPQAAADLHAIEDYIAEKDGEARARLVIDRIHRSLTNLAHWPRSGRLFTHAGRRRLHSFSISSWVVLYEVPADLDGVYVLRVVDGRRDLELLFQAYRR